MLVIEVTSVVGVKSHIGSTLLVRVLSFVDNTSYRRDTVC